MEIDVDIDVGDIDLPTETGGMLDTCSSALFWAASHFTDPICKAHQLWRRISTVEDLHPDASSLEIFGRKNLNRLGMVAFGALGIVTAPVGILLRKLAIMLQSQNFRYTQTNAKEKLLSEEFTLYTHNMAAVGAGYAISDAGVTPWPDREQAIIDQIQEISSDIFVGIEFFDTQMVLDVEKALSDKYGHIYHSCGKRAVGPCSGLFIASKFAIKKFQFTPFPEEYLVGRTKNSTKGFTEIWLENGTHLIASHLQHSEECEYPTAKEIEARKKQMAMIDAVFKASTAKLKVLTGDLNMSEEEWNKYYAHNYLRDLSVIGKHTWGGDEWYATMVGGKQISGPQVYDYTAIWTGGKASTSTVKTTLIETGYDPKIIKANALSDHKGLVSTLRIKA